MVDSLYVGGSISFGRFWGEWARLELAKVARRFGGMYMACDCVHLGPNLSLHPHEYCIVPSGGLGGKEWVEPKRGKAFLFPVMAVSKVFRGRFLTALRKAWLAGELAVPPGMPIKEKAIKE